MKNSIFKSFIVFDVQEFSLKYALPAKGSQSMFQLNNKDFKIVYSRDYDTC